MGMTIDIVRDVVGYEGLYTIDIFGNVTRVKDNKEMSQQISKFGYANVSLCRIFNFQCGFKKTNHKTLAK